MRRLHWIVTTCLAATLTGQGEGLVRERALGMVRTTDGDPWVGARVQLVSRDSGNDRVVVESDAQGRFRASILTGRTYWCWATAPREGRRFRCTPIVEMVARSPVSLTERKGEFHHRLVVPKATTKDLPLRLFCRTEAGLSFALKAEADGFRIPEMPFCGSELMVSTPRHGSIECGHGDTKHWAQAGAMPLKLGVRRLQIHVRSVEAKPVGGAAILWRSSSATQQIATTDKAGQAILELIHHQGNLRWDDIVIWKPGFGLGSTEAPDKQGRCTVTLRPAPSRQARVLATVNTVAGRLRMVMPTQRWRHYHDASKFNDENFDLAIDSDAHGKFWLPPTRRGALIRCELRPEHIAMLPAGWQRGLAPLAILGSVLAELPEPTFCLAKTPPVDFAIRTPDGAPATHAKLFFFSAGTDHPLELHTDRLGRARMLLPDHQSLAIGVQHPSGFRFLRLVLLPKLSSRVPIRCRIDLRAPLLLRGSVVDTAGRGIANAFAFLSVRAVRNPPRPEPDPGIVAGANQLPLSDPSVLAELVQGRTQEVRCDKHGMFMLRVAPVSVRYTVIGRSWGPGKQMRTTIRPVEVVHDGRRAEPFTVPLDWPPKKK